MVRHNALTFVRGAEFCIEIFTAWFHHRWRHTLTSPTFHIPNQSRLFANNVIFRISQSFVGCQEFEIFFRKCGERCGVFISWKSNNLFYFNWETYVFIHKNGFYTWKSQISKCLHRLNNLHLFHLRSLNLLCLAIFMRAPINQ